MTGRPPQSSFPTIRVSRTTKETCFEILVSPRRRRMARLPLTNRMLSHFVDHLCKAAGIDLQLVRTDWPASWEFDHVLCEDVGQLIGRAIAEIHRRRVAEVGVPGRASATCCMDDCRAGLTLSLEGRAMSDWRVESGLAAIDGFVDAWFGEDGRPAGWSSGTNLRQFFDGFAYGAGATIHITVDKVGNLHHLYEALFRALGDAIRGALELPGGQLPGDSSGLAGECRYDVVVEEDGGERGVE